MIKKIAIAGMGVGGSYLLRLLNEKGYEIDCFDIQQKLPCGVTSCAFGASRKPFTIYANEVGLKPDKYVLKSFDKIIIDDVETPCDLVTIDKSQLIKDLQGKTDVKILASNERIKTDNYDLVVDATGVARAYLPPIEDDLVIPTMQYKIKTDEKLPMSMHPGGVGYGWVFGLCNNEYHLGVGCFSEKPIDRLKRIYGDIMNRGEVICGCSGGVRLLTPRYAKPIIHKNIVGIGEAVGAILPISGAGIITGFESAKILAKNIGNIQNYEKALVKRFYYLDIETRLIRKALTGEQPTIFDAMQLLSNSKKAGIYVSGPALLQLLIKECQK